MGPALPMSISMMKKKLLIKIQNIQPIPTLVSLPTRTARIIMTGYGCASTRQTSSTPMPSAIRMAAGHHHQLKKQKPVLSASELPIWVIATLKTINSPLTSVTQLSKTVLQQQKTLPGHHLSSVPAQTAAMTLKKQTLTAGQQAFPIVLNRPMENAPIPLQTGPARPMSGLKFLNSMPMTMFI